MDKYTADSQWAMYSAAFQKGILLDDTTQMNSEDITLSKMSWYKRKILSDPTCIRHTEQLSSQRQKAEGSLQGERGRGMSGWCLGGTELQFCKMKHSGEWFHDNVNVLNTAGLCT